jgi:hypothetical protein
MRPIKATVTKQQQQQQEKPERLGLVEKFERDYAEALAAAHVSAEHTATEGWQALYREHRRQQREAARRHADSLRAYAEELQMAGSTEAMEKALNETKKALEALREAGAMFDRQTVEPVRKCVDDCDRVVRDAVSAAANEEERTPLINRGIEDEMKAAVARADRAKWDHETGIVRIEPARA